MEQNTPIYAGFWRRFIAFEIDSTLVSIITFGLAFAIGQNPFTQKIASLSAGAIVSYLLVRYVVPYFLGLLIIVFCWVKFNGQSLGKRLMHIRVVREDHAPINAGTAILRYVAYAASSILGSLGFLAMLIDAKKQTWHDKIARTYVVKTDEARPGFGAYLLGWVGPLLVLLGFLVIAMVSRGLIDSPNDFRSLYHDFRLIYTTSRMKPEVKVHWDKAQKLMDEVKEYGPVDATYSAQTRPQAREVVEELKLARDIDPDNAIIHNGLGMAYGLLEGTDGLGIFF